MYPILLQLGPIVFPSWHVFYVLGALSSYFLLGFLGRSDSVELAKGELSQLFLVCYAAGYFGARFLSILVEEPGVSGFGDTIQALFRFGPMTFYGGALAAFGAGLIYCQFKRVSFSRIIDVGMLCGFLGLAIGRLGCFLNGDDYGKPVGSPSGQEPFWAVTFPSLEDGVPRWPVQLMESAAVFLFVGVLTSVYMRQKSFFRPGMLGFLCVVLYANIRFFLEFLRDDFRGFAFGTWLSTSQFIALVTLTAAGVGAPIWFRHSAKNVNP